MDVLQMLSEAAVRLGTSTPYICGGAPRDKIMGRPANIVDIDITTGDNTIHHLAKEASIRLPNSSFKTMPDGHSQIIMEGLKIDFSSNYVFPGVSALLAKAGLKNPTSMQLELYSRDFTCNALLMSMDLKKVIDSIGLGIQDINAKVLRTCLPAQLTLGSDHKRVVRVLYMAAKLGFIVDNEIINWVRKNPQSISTPDQRYVTSKLGQALNYNPAVTTKLMDQMGLWQYAPASPQLTQYMSQDVRRV